jgi:hypothetical protein
MAYPHHQTGSTWTERTSQDYIPPTGDIDSHLNRNRLAIHNPHTSLCGHLIHTVGVFVPMIAGELIDDARKYKKTIRLTSIATALGFEVLYVSRELNRRHDQEAKLADCRQGQNP